MDKRFPNDPRHYEIAVLGRKIQAAVDMKQTIDPADIEQFYDIRAELKKLDDPWKRYKIHSYELDLFKLGAYITESICQAMTADVEEALRRTHAKKLIGHFMFRHAYENLMSWLIDNDYIDRLKYWDADFVVCNYDKIIRSACMHRTPSVVARELLSVMGDRNVVSVRLWTIIGDINEIKSLQTRNWWSSHIGGMTLMVSIWAGNKDMTEHLLPSVFIGDLLDYTLRTFENYPRSREIDNKSWFSVECVKAVFNRLGKNRLSEPRLRNAVHATDRDDLITLYKSMC